nr:hypothetical protein CFP56_62891 [Quercus suber]
MSSATFSDAVAVNTADVNRTVEAKMNALNADWTNLPKHHPLQKFAAEELPTILKSTSYNEMYGVELQAPEEGCVRTYT